ncbi:MAG: hypothetical protein BWY32_02902 [bacterium ADurb.Bin243]|nr:MAG: hypothetical protein BWY32_02902 [bacterium ADurb.Bin243]
MITLTMHALKRIKQRGITREAVAKVILYGIEKFYNDMIIYILKKSETEKLFKREGIDIRKYGGIKVVMGIENQVVTAYRCE